jgi:DcuC family C4-dicarboxylate transporter
MTSCGLVGALINAMTSSESLARYAAVFGPFLLAVISGTGNAAAFAFNTAVTPHAAQFGMEIVNMGSLVTLGGVLGRTMSPIAGVTIVCASMAGANPMDVAKRNVPAMIISAFVTLATL